MRMPRMTALLALLLTAACATTAPPPDERDPLDPWEPYNRAMFKVNTDVDHAVLRPVARGYDTVTPAPIKRGVRNFFTNIRSPVVIVNLLLQGRPVDAGTQLKRFFVNSVYGIGGLFDIASAGDLEEFDEDFGQTLAVWGWEESRFVVLPLLGPATLRDGIGRGVDTAPDIAWRWAVEESSYTLIGLNVIQTRAAVLPLERQIDEAYDPYIFMRDGWTQRREHQITNGEEALPDYDSFIEDDDSW